MPVEITNSIGMKLVLIPAGEFGMGSSESAHEVRITRPFYLGTYHVTRGQFRQFVAATDYKTDAEKGEKPGAWGLNSETRNGEFSLRYSWRNVGFEQTDEHPVVCVSWNEAVAFCEWLRRKEGKTYRLPSEAEWEYACRAGTTTRWYSGDDEAGLHDVAWFEKNAGGMTHSVGEKKPNAWGLYDMHGNAWQWCADWNGSEYHAVSPTDDPKGPDSGSGRVHRGGGWNSGAGWCQSASRWAYTPGYRSFPLGFRVALVPADK